MFAICFGANLFAPLLPVMREVHDLSQAQVNFLLAIYIVGLVPALLIGGPASDRRGRRAVVRPALIFSIIGTLQLFAEAQVLQRVAPAIDSQYTPNLSAYTTAFAYNDYNVAAAQSVLIALVAFTLSIVFLTITNRKSA